MGLFLPDAAPGLGGVAPPAAAPGLKRGVAPLGRACTPSQPPTLTIPEKEMATPYSILACKIPWTEQLGELQSKGLKESGTTEHTHIHV